MRTKKNSAASAASKQDMLAEKRPNAAQIDAWKAQHGKLMKVEAEHGGMVIVRVPNAIDIERALTDMQVQAAGNPQRKAQRYDGVRAIYGYIKLYEDPNFMESSENALLVWTQLDQLVTFPKGKMVEL
jgi:hypothetical protein